MKLFALLSTVCAISGCAVPSATESPPPRADYIGLIDRKFISPSDGTIFHLTLGSQLYQDTGGITKVPEGIQGFRQATASYYSIENKHGAGYGEAESSVAEGLEHMIDHIKVQHEHDSGRILVTEDTSDALPAKRYILFTPTHPGYSVHYLAPEYESHFEEQGFPSSPPEIILLPADRAWVGGKILPISRISKSRHPFSLGG
jgi:hypothetical protein